MVVFGVGALAIEIGNAASLEYAIVLSLIVAVPIVVGAGIATSGAAIRQEIIEIRNPLSRRKTVDVSDLESLYVDTYWGYFETIYLMDHSGRSFPIFAAYRSGKLFVGQATFDRVARELESITGLTLQR